ncbi:MULTISPECIES: hypothetical protein [Staphylococcus]|uniref:Membrane-associated protein n=2 Tax=Staphylococcus TaxID=1279 RepID=A0A894T8D7_STAEP|nr:MULTISPECIES: hypothetical protein [Staphylococcus]EHQ80465.1 hypothetical protein SEVCU065_1637 [Staphylococcus epidermidis VCU065]KDP64795.1 hypothetical protein SEVCU013_0073 [Staphylococcus epidermidis VCU013]MBM5874987.1 hypothetical protein [Staphylococcus epidermidis]MBM6250376.1 hypothetical protein [Staphylococcus epidermidis]MCG2217570.1 hypothetical protein [Staphylococcus epidermidis]
MKNTKVKGILILVSIIIAIILFVFVVGYIISYLDPKHSITGYSIAISFIGIFATFGGAYLGAKISGDNTRNLYKEQKKDANNELRYKSEFLFCMKLSDLKENHNILKHYAINKVDINNFEVDNTLQIVSVLDTYAIILMDILESDIVANLDYKTIKKVVDMLSDCNRYYNSFRDIDLELIDENDESVIINVDSPYKLNGEESDELTKIKFNLQSKDNYYESRFVVATFIYKNMDIKLKELINTINNKDIMELFLDNMLHSNPNEGFETKYNFNFLDKV